MPVDVVAGNGSNFPLVQVGDILYGPNYWGTNTSPAVNPNTNGTWTVPCGAQNGSNCYELPVEGSAEDTGVCTFCYTIDNPQKYIDSNGNLITEPVDNTFEVQAYPYYLLGSGDGGRDNTWGAPCGTLNQLATTGRCNSDTDQSHPVWDMRQSRDAVGLPQRLDLITTLKHNFKISKDCSGQAANVENVFFDTYLHRIDRPELWPVGYQAGWGDVNKINSNATETFNINSKLCLPEFAQNNNSTTITNDPGAQATGGVRINNTPITINGDQWAVYFKWENLGKTGNTRDSVTGIQANGICTNSFFYISFIPWVVGTGIDPALCTDVECLDFKALNDWVCSAEFKNRILGTGGFAPVAANKQESGNQANWPLWVYQNIGSPPFPGDDKSAYVYAGIQGGHELWWSENNEQSCACWSELSFETDKGIFGKTTTIEPEPEPEPEVCSDSSTVSVIVDSTCARSSVIIDCGGCTCTPYDLVQISTVDWDCIPLGGYITYQTGGCDCGCDDPFKQCGPMGWYYKYQPDWVDADTVCLENGILTIGPKKGRLEPNVAVQCSFCADSDCP